MKEFEWFEWFEWFGPSPTEPFNSGPADWEAGGELGADWEADDFSFDADAQAEEAG